MLTMRAPLFLLLLVPLALALGAAPRAGRGRQDTLLRGLRYTLITLLIVALAQPAWSAAGSAVPVVALADVSASIAAPQRGVEQAGLRAIPARALRGVVTFASEARLWPPTARDHATTGLEPTGTNIEAAVRLALGAVPAGGRLLLFSDGNQTQGDARAVVAAARDRHVAIDVVVLGGEESPDAALTRLQVPPAVHTGDTVPLLLTVRSTVRRQATLALTEDGHLLGREALSLRAGDNPFLASLSAPRPGWHTYHAAITMAGDTRPQNNALDTTLLVSGLPRLLVVTPDPGGAAPFVAALRDRGLDARVVTPALLPSSPTALDTASAVVLDDVPAPALSARQVAVLERAVRLGGLGLIVLGGPHSLTLGRYTGTMLERLLPVFSATPDSLQQGTIALQLVLDRSGSMNDLAGDVPKITMAQGAANIAIDFALQHKDDYGLVSFDIEPHVLVPLQKVAAASDASRLHQVVSSLTADGGTNIYTALRTGLTQVLRSAAPFKHIVLMTDGRSEPAAYTGLLNEIQQHHVTLSTVGLGADADVGLLRALAAVGKGRFYYTENARDLPRIFAEEARLSAGPTRVDGTIPVSIGALSPVLRSLGGGALPPVHAYPVTVLKPQAVAPLVAHSRGRADDPLLAQWQYGLGRVLVWTPGATSAPWGTAQQRAAAPAETWAGAWLTARAGVWDDAVRWALRGVAAPTLQPRLLPAAPSPTVAVDTLGNTGTFVELSQLSGTVITPRGAHARLSFEQTGPAIYEARLPAAGPGAYRLSIHQAGAPGSASDAVVALPYAPEYLPRPPDRALLTGLAVETGGAVLAGASRETALSGPVAGPTRLELWEPLAALTLLLFMATVLLRASGRRPATLSPARA